MLVEKLQSTLLALSHCGGFENDIPWWASDAVLTRFLNEAVVRRPNPCQVLYSIGITLECHASALRGGNVLGVETVGGAPWFGFRWDTQSGWWCHSFVIDGGLMIDSAPPSSPSPIYFAMPYDSELFRMLWPGEPLPAILISRTSGASMEGLKDENAFSASGGALIACTSADGAG